MSNPLPIPVKQQMQSSGGPASLTLLDVLTTSGAIYYWSDASILARSAMLDALVASVPQPSSPFPILGAPPLPAPIVEAGRGGNADMAQYTAWITSPGKFVTYKSTQTATGTISVQNLSGDSVRRDVAQIVASKILINALVWCRIWNAPCETSYFDFVGTISSVNVQVDGKTMSLSMKSIASLADVLAPREDLSNACGNLFNSNGAFYACGSTAQVPCVNTYGTCSSKNRFKGSVTDWAGGQLNLTQIAQPPPLRLYNPKVAG